MNKNNKNKGLVPFFALFLILLSGQLLTACGGGGGSAAPTVTISNATVIEGDSATTMLIFNLAFSSPTGNASFNFSTSDGTATLGDGDFIQYSGLVNIPPGVTNTTLSVVIYGDTTFEQDETFTMTLSNLVGITATGSTLTATGTITNDDNANPKGFYTGNANVNSGTMLNDLVGLAYNNRLLMFSRTGASNVMYDITFTTITGSTYTGTADVYVDGDLTQGTSQSGVVITNGMTNNSTISGTLGGTGLGAGTFSLLFDTQNNAGATLDKIDTLVSGNWTGNLYGIDVDTGSFSANQINSDYAGVDDTTERCGHVGANSPGIPDTDLNIYQLVHDVIYQGFGTCNVTYASTGHTGFASVITTSSLDDTLVYAFSNGTIALFAVMMK